MYFKHRFLFFPIFQNIVEVIVFISEQKDRKDVGSYFSSLFLANFCFPPLMRSHLGFLVLCLTLHLFPSPCFTLAASPAHIHPYAHSSMHPPELVPSNCHPSCFHQCIPCFTPQLICLLLCCRDDNSAV